MVVQLNRIRPRTRSGPGHGGRGGVLYALPAAVFSLLFFIVPTLGTAYSSLFHWQLYGTRHFAGLANYRAAVHDSIYWSTLRFTIEFALVNTILGVVISFGLALFVRRRRRLTGFFRTAFFLPVTVGYAAAGYLFFYILNPQQGVANYLLERLHLSSHGVDWLGSQGAVFWSATLLTLWKSVGFGMVIFMMAMQAIPEELFDGFRVDGAGFFRTVWRLIVPLTRRSFALLGIISIILGMLTFDQFYTLSHGGPSGSTETAVFDIFQNAFAFQQLGYGAALSMILLVILALLSAAQLAFFRQERA